MSAINIIPGLDGAHITTDSSVYDTEGYVIDFRDKCLVTENGKVAVASRGNSFFGEVITGMISARGWTIDEVCRDGGALLDAAYDGSRERMVAGTGKASNDVYAIGWSEEHGQCVVAAWSSFQEPRFEASPKLLIMAPFVSMDVIEAAKEVAERISPDDFYGTTAVEVMKVQRYDKGDPSLGCGHHYSIGGHILRTDVTKDGITQRVVHEWGEDRIGERIVPKPRAAVLAAPNVAPLVPMSRQQRRRAEKLAKKGRAA